MGNVGTAPTPCALLDSSKHRTGCRTGKNQQKRISSCVLASTKVAMGYLVFNPCFFIPSNFPRESQGCALCHIPEPRFSHALIRNYCNNTSSVSHIQTFCLCKWRHTCLHSHLWLLTIWDHNVARAYIQLQETIIRPHLSSTHMITQTKKSKSKIQLNELTYSYLLPANTTKPV